MSNQTYRDQLKDAAKNRRKYLVRQHIETALAVIGALFICLAFFGVLLAGRGFLADTVPAIFVFLVAVAIGRFGWWFCHIRCKVANSLPYVPPVAEQLAALPVEEVLLRGSVQPAAEHEELLRAAHEGAQMDAAELLRPH
jgi:hypothetical protein